MYTRNTLDCDQSNYSSRIVFSHIPIEFGQTGFSAIKIRRPPKPHPTTKHRVNRWSAAEISPFEFFKMAAAAILDLAKPEIAPFDPPTPKTPP